MCLDEQARARGPCAPAASGSDDKQRGGDRGRVGARAGVGAPALGESAPGRPRLLRAELSSSPKCLSVAPVTTATERLLVIV